MPGETTRFKLAYPEDSDAPDGPSQLKALAEDVEAILGVGGRVAGAGTLIKGYGFTVEKTATGTYAITYSVAFPSQPLILVTPETGAVDRFGLSAEVGTPKSTAKVLIFNAAGELKDSPFGFLAVSLG